MADLKRQLQKAAEIYLLAIDGLARNFEEILKGAAKNSLEDTIDNKVRAARKVQRK